MVDHSPAPSLTFVIGGVVMCAVVFVVGVLAVLSGRGVLETASGVLMIVVALGGVLELYRRVQSRRSDRGRSN